MVLQRVQKIIAESGVCSRRDAEDLISRGSVTVNDEVIKLGDKASETDIIKIKNKLVEKDPKIYIMLYKPKGYITTNSDMYDRKKVIDLLTGVPYRVYPVGRLDRDASGLLLLTNDGDWANKIMHPRYGKEKEYEVELTTPITKKIIAEMNEGMKLKDGWIKPKVRFISKNYCSVVIGEGRNKIIKRIFNHFDFRVKLLKRTRIGKYKLGKLKPYNWMYVNPKLIDAKEKKKKIEPKVKETVKKDKPPKKLPKERISQEKFDSRFDMSKK